jgi:hypothetical protein
MKVGILGSGMVGQNLAKAFAETGHEIIIGTRNPDQQKIKDVIKSLSSNIKIGTFTDAAKFGELLVFAINWSGVENAVKLAGIENFENKIVIDTTNPLDMSTGTLRLAISGDNSAGEIIQNLLTEAKVVKAFNIVGAADMFKPNFEEEPTMFIAGNHKEANDKVAKIINTFGWSEVIDLGDIENARYLEPLLMVRMAFAMKNKSWVAPAFKFVKQAYN